MTGTPAKAGCCTRAADRRLRSERPAGHGLQLTEAAQARWRCVNAPHLVALVRARATLADRIQVEREDQRNAA